MVELPELVARRWSEAKAALESSVRSGSRPGAGVDVDAILENIAGLIRSHGREELQAVVRSSGTTMRPRPRATLGGALPSGDPLVTSDIELPAAADPMMTTGVDPGGGNPFATSDRLAGAGGHEATGVYDPRPGVDGPLAATDGKTPTVDETGEYTSGGGEGASVSAEADTKPKGGRKAERKVPVVPGYEILGELGRGAMGVVYKAQQIGLRRTVALKMILAGEHAGAMQLARFEAEARAIAQIHHPNIVQIYEIGEHAGLPYFSLEFCPGGALDRKLNHEPLPPRRAAELGEQLARAVAAAHAAGVIHRDLKPANILLDAAGVPKVTDFGLARELDEADGHTRTGSVLGTPAYMAPEQAMGNMKAVGPAADQYSLGATLYDLLTGRPPFRGSSVMDTLEQVRTREPVPPAQLSPSCPRDLETICLKALQKEPAKRYPSCEALADDLRAFLDGRPIAARPVGQVEKAWRWARRNPRVAGLAAAVAVLLVALAVGGMSAAVVFENKRKEAVGLREAAEEKRVEAERARDDKDVALRAEEQARKAADQSYDLTRETVFTALDEVPAALAQAVFARGAELQVLQALGVMLEKQLGLALTRGLPDRAVMNFHMKMGDLMARQGKAAEADKHYRAALTITERLLASEQKERDKAKGNHALVLRKLGSLIRDSRRDGAADALKLYAAAAVLQRGIIEAPLSGEIPPAEARASLAGTLADTADLYRRAGVFDRALPPAEESLKLWEEVVKLPTTAYTASAPQALAEAYVLLGRIKARLGKDDEAEEALAEGVDRHRKALQAAPGNVTQQVFTARAAREYGDFLLMRGKLAEATPPHEWDLELTRGLLRTPEIMLAESELSDAYYRSATLALKKGDRPAAEKLYRRCLGLRLEVAESRRNEPRQLIRVANAQARCGQHVEAAAAMETLAAKFKDNPYEVRQAAFNLSLCAGAVSAGRPDAELTAAEKALRDRYADRALTLLEDLVGRLRFADVVQLKTDPDLDDIRSAPRFRALVQKLEAAKKP